MSFGIITPMFPTIALGPIVFSTYTLLIDIGLLGALAWLWRRAPQHERQSARWLDAGLGAAVGAAIGGRAAFALGNWVYFQDHVVEIFRLWEGGYAWPGALIGGALGVFIYGALRREPAALILDELALPALAVAALGWVGCAAASCAAGRDVPPGALPFAVNWPDLYGVVLPRWPAQLIGLALCVIAFAYLLSQRDRRWPRGFRFAASFTLIAIIMFLVSFVRGDDMPLVGGWRLDSAVNAVMIVIGGAAMGVARALHQQDSTAAAPQTLAREERQSGP